MFKLISKKQICILLLLITSVCGLAFNSAQAQTGGDKEIKELSQQINDKQAAIKELRDKIAAYERSLEAERSKSSSLKSQIYILETQIKKKESEIKLNEEEIKKVNLEISKTEDEIKTAENKINQDEQSLSKFLRELYRQDQKKDIEIVVLYSSLSDFFNQIKYTQNVQNKIKNNLKSLKELREKLKQNKKLLVDRKTELVDLKERLEGAKEALEDQQDTKQYLLRKTRNSEARYRKLVNELKAEQARINSEIVALEKTIRAKLSGGKVDKLKQLGEVRFAWPVPSHVITTYFHDPDYPFRYIFEHPAIDIRAAQGTPLRAAASGYVAKVRDGGRYGYSYIMIIHNDGFSTVYGHVSKIYVKPDQFVVQGEVIGATGGMPGTHGAGRLTTGPHLHFEVRKNGIPVNPLDYLP